MTWELLLLGWLWMAILMTVLWVIHFPIKNAGIVDFGWALGLTGIAWIYFFFGTGDVSRMILLVAMISIWSIRLSIYLLFDRVVGKPEEGRYQQLRKDWGGNMGLKFFIFFHAQGLIDVFLSLPILFVALNPEPGLGVWEFAGAGLWVIAILGEGLADRQLEQFKSNPENRGKTCMIGLWRYSRHPNYFFEWLIWCSYALFALGSPYGFVSILCPIAMLYTIFYITGIPPTEEQCLRSRGEEYKRYQETTNVFIPWFPKA